MLLKTRNNTLPGLFDLSTVCVHDNNGFWKFSLNMEKCMKLKPTKANKIEILMFRNSELWKFVYFYELSFVPSFTLLVKRKL